MSFPRTQQNDSSRFSTATMLIIFVINTALSFHFSKYNAHFAITKRLQVGQDTDIYSIKRGHHTNVLGSSAHIVESRHQRPPKEHPTEHRSNINQPQLLLVPSEQMADRIGGSYQRHSARHSEAAQFYQVRVLPKIQLLRHCTSP